MFERAYDSPASSDVMTPLDAKENLDRDVLLILESAVLGTVYASKLSLLYTIITGQRIMSIRNFSTEEEVKWLLKKETILTIVRKLFQFWNWKNDQFYDNTYLNAVYSSLALCLMRNIVPWPSKQDRLKIYSQLSEIEACYYLKGISTIYVRELVVATRPRAEKNYVLGTIERAADENFNYDLLITSLKKKTVLSKNWIEKMVVIEEVLRMPADNFVEFVIDTIAVMHGTIHEPQVIKTFGSRIRDITSDVVDGTKLSYMGQRHALAKGLLLALTSSVSAGFSERSRKSLAQFANLLINRNIYPSLAKALADALEQPQESILADMWPRRPKVGDYDNNNNNNNNNNSNIESVLEYEILKEKVDNSNKRIVENLKQLVMCPLLDDIDKDMVNTSCGHYFSRKMIETWLSCSSKCPLCRRTGITIQGRALWVDGVFDIIKEIEEKRKVESLINSTSNHKIIVGIFLGNAASVVGVKYDDQADMSIINTWSNDSSFVIPTVVYVDDDDNDQIIGWGGEYSQFQHNKLSKRFRTKHIFSNFLKVEQLAYFLQKLCATIRLELQSQIAASLIQEKNIKYLYCLPDVICPDTEDGLMQPGSLLARAFQIAGVRSSNIEIISETKCAAIYALDTNVGGVRKQNQTLHMISWDYHGISQRLYKLCPEERFGILSLYRSPDFDGKIPIADVLVQRLYSILERSQDLDKPYINARDLQDLCQSIRLHFKSEVYDDDLFESIVLSKLHESKFKKDVYTAGLYMLDESKYQDIMHTYIYAKSLQVDLNAKLNAESTTDYNFDRKPQAKIVRQVDPKFKNCGTISISNQGQLYIPSHQIAISMNSAAMKALDKVPKIVSLIPESENVTLAVFGSCAEDSTLIKELAHWLHSDSFSKRRPQGILTVSGSKLGTLSSLKTEPDGFDQKLPISNVNLTGRSSLQIAIDGLWLACEMIRLREA
ncbi:hypothetical protein V1514DRAFT_349252 [Lipomyces japonicus]|uniref:uncharacterized protein n=1 Tax=Lipomyces japonicus TaxID=56871 RepID=UPI0034CFE1C5